MIHALRAETRRLLSRRITLVTLLALLALIGLYQLQVNALVTPPSAAEVAQNQQEYEEYVKEWETSHEDWEAECLESGASREDCAQPRPDPADWGLAATPYDQAVSGAVSFALYLGGLALFVAMASFIGAEATTGSLANWLTFVPDRTRVMASKLLVVTGFSVAVGAAIGVLTVALSAVVTALHGQPLTGLDHVVAMAGRGVIVVTILGILGFCVGLLTFSTGASVGVLLGGIFLIYTRAGLALVSRWAGVLSSWSPEVNLAAILNRGTTYTVSTGVTSPLDEDAGAGYVEKSVSLVHGLGYWGVLLAVVIMVTWVVFRRRDVT